MATRKEQHGPTQQSDPDEESTAPLTDEATASDVETPAEQRPEPVPAEASEQQAAWAAGKPVYVNPGPPNGEG
jgi:hypothetical protein